MQHGGSGRCAGGSVCGGGVAWHVCVCAGKVGRQQGGKGVYGVWHGSGERQNKKNEEKSVHVTATPHNLPLPPSFLLQAG